MNARPVALLLCALLAGCKSGAQVAAAAATVAVAVAAAAVNRAATNECWGSCPGGTMCDPGSGACIPRRESVQPGASLDVRWYPCDPATFVCGPDDFLVCDEAACEWLTCDDDKRLCWARAPQAPAAEVWVPAPTEPLQRPPRSGDDPCRGLCFADETCQVQAGVADCVSRR